jgi:hypothetical protein
MFCIWCDDGIDELFVVNGVGCLYTLCSDGCAGFMTAYLDDEDGGL